MPTLRAGQLFDPRLEAQSAAERREYLGVRLRRAVARAYTNAPYFRRRLEEANLTPADVTSLGDLHKLPITYKDELSNLQAAQLPFGGLLATAVGKLRRLYMSPGPTYVPEPDTEDFWRGRMALVAAGFQAGDVVQNTLSYHLSPGGFMFDSALRSLGCVVVPAGVGQTDLQVRAASDLGVSGYIGTPSFLYTLLTRAKELGTPLRIQVAFVTAEMLPESLRSELEGEFGIRVLQGYGTADLGLLAYECPEKSGLHVHPEQILEVLDLESGQPAPAGQPGQVVATMFDEDYPLVRFAPGDLSAFAPAADCPCGRTSPKLVGLLGRIGDAVKVRGLFIRGSQLQEVFKKFPAVARFQAVVTREQHQDQLTYTVELADPEADAAPWISNLSTALRDAVKVRGEIHVVPPGTIAQGAKPISDQRVWR